MSRSTVTVLALAALTLVAGCARASVAQVSVTTSAPAPATAAATSSAATPTPPAPRRLTVTMSGDLLWHNTVWFSAAADHRTTGRGDEFDFAPLFADMRPVIEGADLALCHEEVPFAKAGGPYRNYPLFAAPPQIGAAIAAAGWDACTTLSNHSIDDGFEGLVRTLDVLDAAGVAHTGTYRTAEEAGQTFFVEASGVKVAIVAGTYSLNGMRLPAGKEWAVDRLDADRMIARAERARAAGADIVLAYVHGGDEYATAPSAQQKRVAEALTASPAIDLVYGSHVHVVQPWTKVNGKWVIYGLGNMVAQHTLAQVRGSEGVTARLTFTEGEGGRFTVSKAEYIPTYVTHFSQGPVRVLHVTEALAAGVGSRERLQAALERTRKAVLSLGAEGLVES